MTRDADPAERSGEDPRATNGRAHVDEADQIDPLVGTATPTYFALGDVATSLTSAVLDATSAG